MVWNLVVENTIQFRGSLYRRVDRSDICHTHKHLFC